MDESGSNKVRLLLAEDDTTNQYVFRAILAAAGYDLEIVGNGLAALERARQSPPRLILLDMMMPVMDGYEAARRIAADPELDSVPVVALTARAMKGDLEKTLEAGCDDYLAKPVSRQVLLEKVREWCVRPAEECAERRRERRQARAA
jgi:two-component system cell cycle response regulator DivK